MTDVQLPFEPHKYQQEVIDNLKRFMVLVCHRRWGKTVLAVMALVHHALNTQKPSAQYGYTAPFLKQARGVAWSYLRQYSYPIPGVAIKESQGEVWYPNGSMIKLFGSDNEEAMRGYYFDGMVIDEVADCRPATWPEIIRPALADRKGWCIFIGTPKGLNQFHDLYVHAQHDPEWYAGMYRVDETDVLDPDEVESSRKTMSENQYRQEFLCDFSAAVDNAMVTIDEVSRAASRSMTPAECEGMPKVIGVDVARFGDDRSVIQRRWGQVALEPLVFQDINNMDLAAQVANQIDQWRPDAVFIDAGRGEGVIDRLRQLGHQVNEVDFGGKAISQRYLNRRAEMWETMALWVREGGCIPNNPDLKTDMCVPTYSFDAQQRLVLESKAKIKERGMKSPDLADALALTFASPVVPQQARMVHGRQKVKTEYDVLAD